MRTLEEVELLAAIRAEIDLGRSRDDVLRAHGKTNAEWTAFEDEIVAELADDLDRGERTRLDAFTRVYDAKRGASPELAPGAQPVSDATEPGTPVLVKVSQIGAITEMVDGGALREAVLKALPFVPSAPTQPSRPVLVKVGSLPTGTEDIDPELLRRQLTPFGGREAPPPSAPPAPPPPIVFASPAPVVQAPPGAQTEQLPDPAAIQEAIARATKNRELASKMTAPPRPDAGTGPALPFGKEGPPAGPASLPLPIEEYARRTAQLERENDPMKTFERLGTNPAEWMSIVHAFSRAFAADPALETQFNTLLRKNKSNVR
ncbi:MAG: hypothetical protein U0414_22025 [Polyangiaceae bacterium]